MSPSDLARALASLRKTHKGGHAGGRKVACKCGHAWSLHADVNAGRCAYTDCDCTEYRKRRIKK